MRKTQRVGFQYAEKLLSEMRNPFGQRRWSSDVQAVRAPTAWVRNRAQAQLFELTPFSCEYITTPFSR